VNELDAYRCMLENGTYIFVREIYWYRFGLSTRFWKREIIYVR
jgi:hypothetical protein